MDERSLEDLIANYLTTKQHYEQGVSGDYDPEYAIDERRLREFLEMTQPDKVMSSRIFSSPVEHRRFLERLRSEISKRGIVDVLRKGVKHKATTFFLYSPLPSELSVTAQAEYRKNKFCVIRQLHYSLQDTRLAVDVVIFINGLPIITMELKNNATCQDTTHAVAQYRTDRDPKDLLFMPKRCAVHFAVDDETIEMCTWLCGKSSWFMPFNKGVNDGAGNPVNPNGLKTSYLWEEILSKRRLSDILEHYAYVKTEVDEETKKKKETMIWPRWHQLEAVRMMLADTSTHEVGQRYLIQHSAGSGKSNSITWLAYQLVEMKENGKDKFDSVVIVTDRVNLDKQLRDNVKAFSHLQNIVDWANTSKELATCLDSGKKIILTTVHKFSFILGAVGSELAKKHFAVIIDEAHSSQSGKMSGKENQVLSGNGVSAEDEDEDKVNELVDSYMKGRLMAPNANFYAFTATPKNKTLEVFGMPYPKENGEIGHRPFHVYSMKQAIDEGFILDVLKNYTTYRSYYRIKKSIEDDPEFDREQAMKKLHYYVESQPETVKEKAKVMVEHFHTSVAQKIGGEARCMICTTGIERAIDYFFEVNKLLKERNSQYKAIVAFSGEFDYHGKKVDEAQLNGFPSAKIEKEFRKGMYRFLIVADKFQTGYDEPLLHTMYVDKPLHGLQAVQTLSRLNRTMPGKHETSVIDFVNTTEDIEDAFQPYYKTTLLSKETDPNKLNDLLATIEEYDIYTDEELDTFIKKYWSNTPRTEIDPLLDTMAARFNALSDDDKVKCKSAIKAYIRTYEFLSTILVDNSSEWEKKDELLSLLVHKLPSLGMDDLTKGLLDSVDFDRYRQEKIEEKDIQLRNQDAEVNPVPTSISGQAAEPDMQHLSTIESEFNELFGNIDWTDEDIVRTQLEKVVTNVAGDDTVINSMLNSDEQTAAQDSNDSVQSNMAVVGAASSELMTNYWRNQNFRDKVNQYVFDRVRSLVNPPYDEVALKEKINEGFRKDFADLCDGEHYPTFSDVLDLFFRVVNIDTIPDLQGLRSILRRTLNCLYRAQHREEDYRTWYADLVSRFEAFLKKIYWLEHGVRMPLNAEGREPALRETISYFPKIETLYGTSNPKFEQFKTYYHVLYNWRNNENHRAVEISADLLPTGLHAVVAMYLFAVMVTGNSVKGKV